MDKYELIFKHYEKCFQKFGNTPKGVDWPNESDLIVRYEKMLEFVKPNSNILDFGCGYGFLFQYLEKKNSKNLNYFGLDISKIFIDYCNKTYKKNIFYQIDILKDDLEILPPIDYILINGVFTEKRELNDDEMKDFLKKILNKLFKICKKGLVFNIMSPIVDFKDDKLFYLSFDELGKFLKENLTKKIKFDMSYGLWEYCCFVYK